MAYLRESSQRQRQQINQRPYGSFNAWLLGSSVASLATAVYLIRDADVPPSSIHVIESRRTPEDGLAITGDPVNGYDHRGACMPSLSDQCIEDQLAPVHSAMVAETTSTENVDKRQTVGGSTKLLIQKNNDLEIIHPRNIGVSLRVRAQLAVFMLWPEHSLGRKTISQCFGKGFFNSKLWAIWSTL
jgi:oleate hydratase